MERNLNSRYNAGASNEANSGLNDLRIQRANHIIDVRARMIQKVFTASIFFLALLFISLINGCAKNNPDSLSANGHQVFSNGTLEQLEYLVKREVAPRGDLNAAVLMVAHQNKIVLEKSFGKTEQGEDIPIDAMFDVASLTKPMATTAAIGLLQCEGKLSLSDKVGMDTIGSLLIHDTTLPENINWQELNGEQATLQSIKRLADAQRKESAGYSNIGFVLLGLKVEEIADENLESFIRRELWQPLGMNQTMFTPSPINVMRSAEDIKLGRPYDPLADFILQTSGHSPGHSGLFSTARDVTLFCQALMNPDDDSVPILNCLSSFMFTTPSPTGKRSFGFERSRGKSWVHTGYTGCVMWLDPDSGTSMVLLTNATLSESENFYSLQDQLIRELDRGIERNDP